MAPPEPHEVLLPVIDGDVALDSRPYTSCTDWNDKLRALVTGAERPNVLVVSTSFYVMMQNGDRVSDQPQAAFADALGGRGPRWRRPGFR